MVKNKIAIATQTKYNENNEVDRVRYGIALRTMKEARKLRIPIFVVDGGSQSYMIREFRKLGAKVSKQKGKSFASSVKQALGMACEKSEKIFWMEAEKTPLLPYLKDLSDELDSCDLVMPQRDWVTRMYSYPQIQLHLEEAANNYWCQLTGANLDISFGARGTHKEIIEEYFLNYDEKDGKNWECLHLPVMKMIKHMRSISGQTIVNFLYPPEQRNVEEFNQKMIEKRVAQLNSIFPAWKRYWEGLK